MTTSGRILAAESATPVPPGLDPNSKRIPPDPAYPDPPPTTLSESAAQDPPPATTTAAAPRPFQGDVFS